MTRQSIVVTGLGVVTPIGCTIDVFWTNCLAGKVGISRLEWAKEFGCRSRVGGAVRDEELQMALRPLGRLANHLGRHHHFALAAALQATRAASITPSALVVGTATGGFQVAEQHYAERHHGFREETLHFDDLANIVAENLDVKGPRVTISTGCTSGVDAIGHALWMLREGRWKSVLVVAAEAPLTPSTLAAFDVLGAVTAANNDAPESASRPFSGDRSGFVLGEAAGAIILERADEATARRATTFARLIGFGSVNSGYHMTSIQTDGRAIARSIVAALEDTGRPDDIRDRVAYANLHGSGTRQNDKAESAALHDVFGSRARTIPVNSTKALVGHPLGAAGLVESIHLILSIYHRTVTPAVHADMPDPDIDLRLPKSALTPYPISYALKTGSGFSGIHSSLLFETLINW